MTIFCKTRLLYPDKTCEFYSREACESSWKFPDNCQIIAYEKMLTEYVKRTCVKSWGGWMPQISIGNNGGNAGQHWAYDVVNRQVLADQI